MRISVVMMAVLLATSVAAPAMADIVNGTCDQGLAEVSATEGSTALTGWVFNTTVGGTLGPIGNWYIGKNIRTWNQRPGYTTPGVGMVFHANPAPSGVVRECQYTQVVTGMAPGAWYNASAWFLPVLVTGQPCGATLRLDGRTPADSVNPTSPWILGEVYSTPQVWGQVTTPVQANLDGKLELRVYITLGYGVWSAKSTPNACFDDVTLTIPEPGTACALLTGLPILGLLIRRRA